MRVKIFSAHRFEETAIRDANRGKHDLTFIAAPLGPDTAALAVDADVVSVFVNDNVSVPVLDTLRQLGARFITLRCAGFNQVAIEHARKTGFRVARVPAYSPHAIAEHTIALMLALNRKLIRANSRVHELNFSLDGLTGFDMNGKIVGVVGTGSIGKLVCRILHSFGCTVLAADPFPDPELQEKYGVVYTTTTDIFQRSDIITLHAPLTPDTHYLINKDTIGLMKNGVMLINTGRGALIHTREVINALKTGKIGYLGLDVYEEEAKLFFEDHSLEILQDDMISRLLSFKNVLITSHQGFLTDTALKNIAETTIYNIDCFANNAACANELF